MNGRFARLGFDIAALALLLLSMGYWWLGNMAHELFGTAMFAILIRHLARNRRWFVAIRRGRYDGPRVVRLVLNLLLALAMTVLLLSSLAISRSLFAFLPIGDYFSLREIHWFAAYWVIVIVGLHIGLHWHLVMGLLQPRLPILTSAPVRIGGWITAGMVAVAGLNSSAIMGLWTRLRFDYSMVMWDFSASTVPYFAHWLAIMLLHAVIGCTTIRIMRFGFKVRRQPSS